MSIRFVIPVLFFFLWMFSSCSSEQVYPEAMRRAIGCMEHHPDSARIYLASLDSSIGQEAEETRMYYRLLKIKAGGREELARTSDSLLVRVADFYRDREGEEEKLLMAYYYLGRVYRKMGDSPNSLVVFHKAAEIGERLRRHDMLGRIYEQINYIYAFQGLYAEALEILDKSYYNYKLINDLEGLMFFYRNKARIFDKKSQLDSMIYYYHKSYNIARTIYEEDKEKYMLSEYVSAYIDHGLIKEGEYFLKHFPQDENETDNLILYSWGMIHFYYENYDLAESKLKKVLSEDNIYWNCDIYRVLSEIKERKGDYQQAYYYSRKSLALKDSIADITKTEAVDRVRSLYNYSHIQKQNKLLQLEDARNEKFIYLFVLLSWILLSLLVSLYYYYRHQKKLAAKREAYLLQLKKEQEMNSRSTWEQNRRKIEDLTVQLQQAEVRNEQIRMQLQTQKDALEMSNRKIQLNLDEKALAEQALRKSEIAQWFSQERNWDVLPESSEKWLELEKQIALCFPDFVSQLRFLYPSISRQEWHICLLVKLKIPVKAMAKLLSCSNSSVSNIRSRLYKKIFKEKGGAERFDKFVAGL